MDKSWITKPRNSPAYDQGVKGFIEFAFQHGAVNDMILCPCPKCGFSKRQTRAEVYDHLICKPFPKGYTVWYLHGESHPNEATNVECNQNVSSQSNDVIHDPIRDMVNDAFGVHEHSEQASPTLSEGSMHNNAAPNFNQNRNVADEFYDLSNDGQQPLYEGCANHSKLSFILKLYHIKCLCGMTDKAMTMILELLNDAFPDIKIPIARLQKEMETQLHRPVTRAELFQVSHTTSDGSFINDEARQNHEELIILSQNSSENEAFINVFGKEHPGYVRGLGLGVVPTQVYGSSSNTSNRQNASDNTQTEIAFLKETVLILSRQVEQNQNQIAFLTQQLGNQGQNVATNENAGSTGVGRRSSQDSHSAHSEHSSDPDA